MNQVHQTMDEVLPMISDFLNMLGLSKQENVDCTTSLLTFQMGSTRIPQEKGARFTTRPTRGRCFSRHRWQCLGD